MATQQNKKVIDLAICTYWSKHCAFYRSTNWKIYRNFACFHSTRQYRLVIKL